MSSDTTSPPPSLRMHDYGVTVSLSGAFHPTALQPAWFGLKGVLGQEEADNPKDFFVHQDFLRFATDHLAFEASREIVEVTTRDQGNEDHIEQVLRRLLEALPPPPITEMSIARYGHFSLNADQEPVNLVESAFASIGGLASSATGEAVDVVPRLATRSWQGVVLPGLWSDILDAPRLDELTMRGDRTDGREGSVLITVEPSLIVPGGAFLAHIDVIQISLPQALSRSELQRPASTEEAATVVADVWRPTRQETFRTFEILVRSLAGSESTGEVEHG